jgi:hypothetical protein
MKRQFFYLFVIAIVAMLGLSACEKDNLKPELKRVVEIIESEIVNSGLGKEVATAKTTNVDGVEMTVLSYISWIQVKGRTKADFNNMVSVSIVDTIPSMAELMGMEFEVKDFNLSEPLITCEDLYRNVRYENHEEEGYTLEITNREVVYKVSLNDFSFSYVMCYEVPVYRDSATSETMPYYKYEDITDKGYTVTPQGPVVRGSKTYNSALYRHEIEVTVNGETFPLYAEITLLQDAASAGDPYIFSSQIDSVVTQEYNNYVTLTVDASHTWSDGVKNTTHNVVDLYGYVDGSTIGTSTLDTNVPYLEYNGFCAVDSLAYNERSGDIVIHHRTAEYILDYGDCVIRFKVISDGATYDDGTLYAELVGNELVSIGKVSDCYTKVNSEYDIGDGNLYDVYLVEVVMRVTFGSYYRDVTLLAKANYLVK